ncbi:MAG: M23 family metallopeptidase [Bacteroidetes bacterium]|nr:M23 family metallopeptidase [Bacteroidota bacterium]
MQNSLKKNIVIGFLVLLNLPVWGQNETNLIAPLELPFSLSGTFGEPRNTHNNLGIDVKTKGKEGLKVKSVAEGYISRIRVSLGGYGKTLYINHPDQTTSVYAHLKKFAPKIESYVKEMQYEKESYTLNSFQKKINFVSGLER